MSFWQILQFRISRGNWVNRRSHTLASLSLTIAVLTGVVGVQVGAVMVNAPAHLDEFCFFLLAGIISHSLGLLGHETYHGTFFRSNLANNLAGACLFHYPLLGRYSILKPLHLQHHRHFGTKLDPDIDHWGFEPGSRRHKIEILRIVCGLTFIHKVIDSVFGKEVSRPDNSTRANAPGHMDFIGIGLIQSLILILFSIFGEIWRYFFMWLLPIVTIGALIEHLRVYCEHNSASLRVFVKPRLLEILIFSRASFRFHGVHHLSPSTPWFALRSRLNSANLRIKDDLDFSDDYLSELCKIFK